MANNYTHLGKTIKNYGRKYNIISTNLSGEDILNDDKLVPNALIISSPTHGGFDQIGEQASHAMLFTDYEGSPVRLTYTIIPGNGLVVNAYSYQWNSFTHPYTVDTLSLETDRDSLTTTIDKGILIVNKPNIIDNYTLMVQQPDQTPHTYIKVITANLEKATDVKYGITRGDNYTISANEGLLSVNTWNLDYADDTTNTPGIVRPNPDTEENYSIRTIEASNGILNVVTANLDKATENNFGVVILDGETVTTNSLGYLSVITSGLDYATPTSYGTVRPDNWTIQVDNGVIRANSRNMDGASNEEFGVVKLDPASLGVSTDGYTYVNRWGEIEAILNRYMDDYNYIISRLIDIENRLVSLENTAAAEYIYSFTNNGTTITTLDQPYWDPELGVVISNTQEVSVQFSINTNCKFHVSVRYENNISDSIISLFTVKYGDNAEINASGLSQHIFDSTNKNESTLNFKFRCENYSSNSNEDNALTTVIIKVSSINDASIYKQGNHIFRHWNKTKFIVAPEPEPEEVTTTEERIEEVSNGYLLRAINDNNEYCGSLEIRNIISSDSKATGSFNFILSEKVKKYKIIKTIKTKYLNGIQQGEPEVSESEPILINETIKNLPVFMSDNISAEVYRAEGMYFANITSDLFGRDRSISGIGTEENWIFDSNSSAIKSIQTYDISDENCTWLTYQILNIGFNPALSQFNDSNTANSSLLSGKSILKVHSTINATTQDRMAKLRLTIKDYQGNDLVISQEEGSYQSLIFKYYEDVEDSICNLNVDSICGNTVENALTINISRSANVMNQQYNWGVKINYIYKTSVNTVLSVSNLSALSQYNESYGGTRTDQSEQTESDFRNVQVYPMIISDIPGNVNNITVKIGRESNSGNSPFGTVKVYDTYNERGVSNSSSESLIITSAKIDFDEPNLNGFEIPASVLNILENPSAINTITMFSINSINYRFLATGNSQYTEITNNQLNGITIIPTFSSNGVWPTNSGAIVQQNKITFGNAKITRIQLDPWDDYRMKFTFTLRPGSDTVIPTGAIIKVPRIMISGISPNFILFNNNNSYPYNDFYANIIIGSDGWTNTGTTFTMTLSNTIPVAPDPNTVSSSFTASVVENVYDRGNSNSNVYTFTEYQNLDKTVTNDKGYNSNTGTISNVGINEPTLIVDKGACGDDGMTLAQHVSVGINAPMIQNITGIKFNILLEAEYNGQTSIMNFAASMNQFTPKFAISANYNNGKAIECSIVNALYSDSNIISQAEQIEEQTSSVEKLAEEIDGLKEIISSLTGTNTGNTSAEYQPNGGITPQGVSDLIGGRAGTDVQNMY